MLSDDDMRDIEKGLRLARRHEALIDDLVSANGDEYKTLNLLQDYLIETGAPRGATIAIMARLGQLANEKVRHHRKSNSKAGAERPVAETMVLATCAATVTAMKEKAGVRISDAIRRVAAASGIDQQAVKSFRDNINRGLQSDYATGAYRDRLADCRAMSAAELKTEALRQLKGLSRIC